MLSNELFASGNLYQGAMMGVGMMLVLTWGAADLQQVLLGATIGAGLAGTLYYIAYS